MRKPRHAGFSWPEAAKRPFPAGTAQRCPPSAGAVAPRMPPLGRKHIERL